MISVATFLRIEVKGHLKSLYIALAFVFALSFLIPEEAFSQRRKKKLRTRKASRITDILADESLDLSLSSTFERIIIAPTDSNLYDPLTIENFKRLRDISKPIWNDDDYDPERMRRASEKAFAMQAGRTMSDLLHRSDLQDVYRDLKKYFRNFQDLFRYSVQDNGEKIQLSKATKGKKLLELSVEVNLKRGVDPQLRIGENTRFRYDYYYKRAMFEYGFDF